MTPRRGTPRRRRAPVRPGSTGGRDWSPSSRPSYDRCAAELSRSAQTRAAASRPASERAGSLPLLAAAMVNPSNKTLWRLALLQEMTALASAVAAAHRAAGELQQAEQLLAQVRGQLEPLRIGFEDAHAAADPEYAQALRSYRASQEARRLTEIATGGLPRGPDATRAQRRSRGRPARTPHPRNDKVEGGRTGMAIERESDGIGELAEDLLRIAILIGTRLAQRHAQQRAHRLEQAARQSEQAREREERIQALERDAALGVAVRCAVGVVVGSRRCRRHPPSVDDGAGMAGAGSPRGRGRSTGWPTSCTRRYGLDVRETDPSILGQQPQLPEYTTLTAEELAVYDQRLHEQIERLAEQHAQLAGEDALDPAAQERLAQVQQQTGELTELRDLIAEDLADRRQQEPQQARQDASDRQERRELVDAELVTGSPAAGIPPAVAAVDAAADAYDTHERREQLRERLQNAGVSDQAVDARVVADTGQGLPAAEAVARRGPSARARPAGRNPKGRAPAQQRRR